MRIFVAVVHAIGEDNEGNTSVVGKTREELNTKLLEFFNENETKYYHSLADAQYDYSWNVDEHDIPVAVPDVVFPVFDDFVESGARELGHMRDYFDQLVDDALVDYCNERHFVDIGGEEKEYAAGTYLFASREEATAFYEARVAEGYECEIGGSAE